MKVKPPEKAVTWQFSLYPRQRKTIQLRCDELSNDLHTMTRSRYLQILVNLDERHNLVRAEVIRQAQLAAAA